MMPNMMGNPMQMLQQLKANPIQFILQRRMQIPQNVNVRDPNAILNYLVQSGQVNQNAINTAYEMAQKMGKQ